MAKKHGNGVPTIQHRSIRARLWSQEKIRSRNREPSVDVIRESDSVAARGGLLVAQSADGSQFFSRLTASPRESAIRGESATILVVVREANSCRPIPAAFTTDLARGVNPGELVDHVAHREQQVA